MPTMDRETRYVLYGRIYALKKTDVAKHFFFFTIISQVLINEYTTNVEGIYRTGEWAEGIKKKKRINVLCTLYIWCSLLFMSFVCVKLYRQISGNPKSSIMISFLVVIFHSKILLLLVLGGKKLRQLKVYREEVRTIFSVPAEKQHGNKNCTFYF